MSYFALWPLGIAVWLVVGWAAFAFFEARALRHGDRAGYATLSLALYTVGSKFPLSIFAGGLLIGLFFGSLATHVLWHWCPPGSVSTGQLVPLPYPSVEQPACTIDPRNPSVVSCPLSDALTLCYATNPPDCGEER